MVPLSRELADHFRSDLEPLDYRITRSSSEANLVFDAGKRPPFAHRNPEGRHRIPQYDGRAWRKIRMDRLAKTKPGERNRHFRQPFKPSP